MPTACSRRSRSPCRSQWPKPGTNSAWRTPRHRWPNSESLRRAHRLSKTKRFWLPCLRPGLRFWNGQACGTRSSGSSRCSGRWMCQLNPLPDAGFSPPWRSKPATAIRTRGSDRGARQWIWRARTACPTKCCRRSCATPKRSWPAAFWQPPRAGKRYPIPQRWPPPPGTTGVTHSSCWLWPNGTS